jgi:hypothetical protein
MKTFEQYISERLKSMVSFNKKVEDILFTVMGKENVKLKPDNYGSMKHYIINTIYGQLNISLHSDKSEVFSIFMRFETPNSVKDHPEMNQYSGKWNIHTSEEIDALEQFEERLNEIKP